MINISFDNPYLLLLLIPMLAFILVPYFIAIRRENKSKASTIALVLHTVIVLLVIFAVAGMSNTTVITETELYVLADLSHSTSDDIDLIDEYIAKTENELPRNSKMGVITFGKDYALHTPLGEEITSVRESTVDHSATDIVSALRYADSLFGESSIKRVVIITDGLSTDPEATGELIRVIGDMKANDVYIDAVYVDSNISNEIKEIQVSDVEFNPSTYIGHDTTVNVMLESTYDARAIVTLMRDGAVYSEKTEELIAGYNIVNFDIDADEEGEYDYSVTFTAVDDSSKYNNSISFTQVVNGKVNVLAVTSTEEDKLVIEALYGDSAVITSCVKPLPPKPTMKDPYPRPEKFVVPYTVEDLCYYDEIILYNVDVRDIDNCDTFLSSLDTVVSVFGKSLITAGNNQIQNKDDASLVALKNMLPVKFGNEDSDPKLYTLVIDSSRSMEFKNADFFVMAKKAAEYLLGMLNEDDYFAIIHFSGEVYPLAQPKQATKENITEALANLNAVEVTQGTMMGAALDAAFKMVSPLSYSDKQIMLISDGMSFEGGEVLHDDPVMSAEKLKANNITVSTLNTGNTEQDGIDTMKSIASAGGGNYYYAASSEELSGVMFSEIADDVTESVIEKETEVIVNKQTDSVLKGVDSLGSIYGYVYANPKASADTVLTVEYVRKGGSTADVPLYAYWSYGNGKVSTLTTVLDGAWVSDWQDESGIRFLSNILYTNTPTTRTDYPYTINIEFDGKNSHIEIIPTVLNPDATMTVKIIMPDGQEISEKLTFDSYRYFYKLETGKIGKYRVEIVYDLVTKSYPSTTVFDISYSPEYDSFTTYTPAVIHTFMRNNGNVFEDGDIKLEVDENKIATYVLRFTVPFLAAAAVLYIVDTVLRKLKWADIKSFFKIRKKGAKK